MRAGFFQFKDVTVAAQSPDKSPIPFWLGANWRDGIAPGALKRVAKFCDGFIPVDVPSDAYGEIRQRIEGYAKEEGRDIPSFEWGLFLWVCLGDSIKEARREAEAVLTAKAGSDHAPDKIEAHALGTPRDVIQAIERYVSAGVGHFIIRMNCASSDAMRQYGIMAREVLPHFTRK